MNPNQSSFFEEGLKLISFCPLCQAKQGAMEASTVEETADNHLVHLHCRQCQSSILALVTVTPMGLSSIGMITDLSVADARRFKESEPIDFDEVIALNLNLKNHSLFYQTLVGV